MVVRAAKVDQTIVIGLAADSGAGSSRWRRGLLNVASVDYGRTVPYQCWHHLCMLPVWASKLTIIYVARRLRQVDIHATDDIGLWRLSEASAGFG